jgi:hypothetical protein
MAMRFGKRELEPEEHNWTQRPWQTTEHYDVLKEMKTHPSESNLEIPMFTFIG